MTEQSIEELIQKYADGTSTEGEVQRLMNWYHGASIGEVEWRSEAPNERALLFERILQRIHNGKGRSKKIAFVQLAWVRVAVAVMLMAGASIIALYFLDPFAPSYITINNPSGEIRFVKLPDSSSVWLNAKTSLRYAEDFRNNRDVLLDGEAFFEVTHQPEYPFRIQAGLLRTTVLGTSFVVKAYGNDSNTDISVLNGRVRVTNDSGSLAVLTPSKQLQFNRKNGVASTATVDTAALATWRKGRLSFDGESLADIAMELERWYGIQIVFSNPDMKACRYYMSFNNDIPLAKLLSQMAAITHMQFDIDRKNRIVSLSGTDCP